MSQLSPKVLIDTVARTLERQKSFALFCFWYQCAEGRDALQSDLQSELGEVAAIPVVLRAPLFTDPNAWAVDAVHLVNDMRAEFEAHAETIASGRPCAIVIISRSGLSVGQSSSPASLPDWFPRYGGAEVTAFVRDLRQETSCSLNDDVAAVPEISELLFRLEAALSQRVSALLQANKHHGLAFWDSCLKSRSGLASRSEFAGALASSVRLVGDVRSFRPSMRSKASLVAAMWTMFVDEAPAKLLGRSNDLAGFLGLSEVHPSAGSFLFPVLFRGTNDSASNAVTRYCRDLVVVVGGACQLVTASAHADQYGLVNAELLHAHSCDVRRFLSHAITLFSC